jgi:hypothetical protein
MTRTFVAMVWAGLLIASVAWGAGPNNYQVTGPVLEVKDNMITVQKGKDRWELGRDSNTKVNGDLKPGSKVTIQYHMIADTVDVKPAKAAK